uniref:polynucleotide adenylyltransferase n=1 Tax=Knipowitschia caucasica TaxID=637954 RepID=A0AAV2KA61_KNICA
MVCAKINRRRVSDTLGSMDSSYLQEMDSKTALFTVGRNIYCNRLSFLCGVSFGIMLARICQLYPYSTAAVTLAKFFRVYSSWNWPTPAMLRIPEQQEQIYNLPMWNLRMNVKSRCQQVPIITPSYPEQNSAFNMKPSPLNVMTSARRYVMLRVKAPTQAKHEEW